MATNSKKIFASNIATATSAGPGASTTTGLAASVSETLVIQNFRPDSLAMFYIGASTGTAAAYTALVGSDIPIFAIEGRAMEGCPWVAVQQWTPGAVTISGEAGVCTTSAKAHPQMRVVLISRTDNQVPFDMWFAGGGT